MKKILAVFLTVAMVVCVCGCSNNTSNLSSDMVEVEVEEIIMNESGSSATNPQSSTTSGADKVNQNSQHTQGSAHTQTSEQSSSTTTTTDTTEIDYNKVVEVDICDTYARGYLNANDAHNQYDWLSKYSGTRQDYQNLSVDWVRDGSSNYTVYFSENADFSNSIKIQTSSNNIKTANLIPGKTYYWKVIGMFSDKALEGGRIKVKDAPVRWIGIDGTENVRDMGGWKTESGKTVKYGMLYRGKNIDKVTAAGIKTIKQLGLKTELDLRYSGQKYQLQGTGMNYVFLETSAQYDYIFDEPYSNEVKTNYKKIFELLSDESNYPFYTHCSAGADRTGTFAFLLNGLLGVSYEDLTRDFELTSFSSSGKRWRGNGTGGTFGDNDLEMTVEGNYVAWGKLNKRMMEYGSKNGCTTLSQSIEHYLINYVGVPKSQIDSFKNIMLK